MANYIPQTDYTSRDYESIRRDVINLIPEYAPEWTNRDPADFGMTILEAYSYMGDLLNYYIDRAANEAFITTASQRESVLQLARLLSYKPTEATASTVTLTFKNSTASPITVPAGTKVSTTTVVSGNTTRIVFETDAAVTVPAKVGIVDGAATVLATQGETPDPETIGTSNGQPNQLYQLSESPVINGSTSVTVGGIEYTEVPYLIDYQGYDPVYTTVTNANGVTYIVFGDGVSGRIPPNNAEIICTYRVGGGIQGNVSANTIKFIETNQVNGLSVLNQYVSATNDGSATGGADAESTDSIRINAPLSTKSLNRAVSISDYSALTLQVSGIAKATAIADVYTSVNVFFAPYGDKGVENDGTTPSAVFNALKTDVTEYLKDKIPANTTVTFQPPSYVGVNITAAITCLPQYRQSTIQASVESILNELLDFDNVSANTIKFIETNQVNGLSVLNQYVSATNDGSATGGADAESTDSIRINAPLSTKSLNRAVSISDYSALTLQVSGIAKATAIADVYTSVNVFFAPYGDKGVENDGTTPSAVFNALKTDVTEYLKDKIPANTTVTFQPPSYVGVNITAAITCLPQYRQSTIQASVESILNELLDFDNVLFNDRISLQDVISAISSIPGVAYTQVSKLVRQDQDVTRTITNKALTSSVATLTTSAAHGFTVGQTVKVTGVDATFDGTFIITAVPTTTTFSYALVAANVTSAAATGQSTILTVSDIICGVNEIPEANDITLTLSGGILV